MLGLLSLGRRGHKGSSGDVADASRPHTTAAAVNSSSTTQKNTKDKKNPSTPSATAEAGINHKTTSSASNSSSLLDASPCVRLAQSLIRFLKSQPHLTDSCKHSLLEAREEIEKTLLIDEGSSSEGEDDGREALEVNHLELVTTAPSKGKSNKNKKSSSVQPSPTTTLTGESKEDEKQRESENEIPEIVSKNDQEESSEGVHPAVKDYEHNSERKGGGFFEKLKDSLYPRHFTRDDDNEKTFKSERVSARQEEPNSLLQTDSTANIGADSSRSPLTAGGSGNEIKAARSIAGSLSSVPAYESDGATEDRSGSDVPMPMPIPNTPNVGATAINSDQKRPDSCENKAVVRAQQTTARNFKRSRKHKKNDRLAMVALYPYTELTEEQSTNTIITRFASSKFVQWWLKNLLFFDLITTIFLILWIILPYVLTLLPHRAVVRVSVLSSGESLETTDENVDGMSSQTKYTLCALLVFCGFWCALNNAFYINQFLWRRCLRAFDTGFFLFETFMFSASLIPLFCFDIVGIAIAVSYFVGVLCGLIFFDAFFSDARRRIRGILVLVFASFVVFLLLLFFRVPSNMCYYQFSPFHGFLEMDSVMINTKASAQADSFLSSSSSYLYETLFGSSGDTNTSSGSLSASYNSSTPSYQQDSKEQQEAATGSILWGVSVLDFCLNRGYTIMVLQLNAIMAGFRHPQDCVVLKSRVRFVSVHGQQQQNSDAETRDRSAPKRAADKSARSGSKKKPAEGRTISVESASVVASSIASSTLGSTEPECQNSGRGSAPGAPRNSAGVISVSSMISAEDKAQTARLSGAETKRKANSPVSGLKSAETAAPSCQEAALVQHECSGNVSTPIVPFLRGSSRRDSRMTVTNTEGRKDC